MILLSKTVCSAATTLKNVNTINRPWNYQFDENGYAKRDETLTHPRCVWNLLKEHVSRYTPDVVEKHLRYAKKPTS